ncbi:interleukin-13 receptor subunit alpha-1 [Syngnathus typhle]
MFVKRLLLSVAVYFLVEVESRTQTGQLLPPRNLTLRWLSDFEPQLWWGHNGLPPNCEYNVLKRTADHNSEEQSTHQSPPSVYNLAMEGGSLFFSVQTTCNHTNSEPSFLNVTYPELVSNVRCSIISSALTRCSWVPLGSPRDLAFYYQLANEVEDVASAVMSLSECPHYTLTNGMRTGCCLKSKAQESILMLFNATLNGGLVKNTFQEKPVLVTPHPLNWSVSKVPGYFNVSWTPPDVFGLPQWKFVINYTECDKEKTQMVQEVTWLLLGRVSHCQYRMTLRACSPRGDSEWSEIKYFEADHDADAVLYAAIVIIPLLCAGLASLACVCFRRNREVMFSNVPQPRDFLSDIHNNKSDRLFSFNFLEKEEEECQISVVTEQQQQPHLNVL